MKYNTKEIYFGWPIYKVKKGDIWYTNPEVFVKQEDLYAKINSKNDFKYNEYTPGTDEYITIAGLRSMADMMSDQKQIPEQVSGMLVRLYLMKYRVQTEEQIKKSTWYNVEAKTK